MGNGLVASCNTPPVLIQIDGLIALVRDLFSDADVEPFLGWKYNFLISGLALTLSYWALVFYYQRSFDYAITSNAVIFKHAFLLSRAHRRILFDRISEVQVERTPFGTMTGFATSPSSRIQVLALSRNLLGKC